VASCVPSGKTADGPIETDPRTDTREIPTNPCNLVIAAPAAVLLAPAAFAATTATRQDCASLQAKFEEDVAAHAGKAKDWAAEGEKPCKEGQTSAGEKKLHGAIQERTAR